MCRRWRDWLMGVLLALMRWLVRHDVYSLAIVPVDHCIGGSMAIVKEGKPFQFNVVAKNALGRVLPKPADLLVAFDGVVYPAQADGTYVVYPAKDGIINAHVPGLDVNEGLTVTPDNDVAALFIVAVDGTLTPAVVPIGQ